MNVKGFLATLSLAAVATAALATVTFDSATGTGFVGKGDVQLAFGWNNAQLQANASGLSFTYMAVETYDAECYWETTTGKGKVVVHDITVPRHSSVSATVTYQARARNQINGFNLTGFGAMVTEGTVPALGDACPGNSNEGNNPGTIVAVNATGSTGGLYVNYGTSSVLLTPPAP